MNPKIIFGLALAVFTAFPSLPAQKSVPADSAPAIADNAESTIATQIASVIVFPSGARVTRSAEVSLKTGEQEIVLVGIPANIHAESLVAETGIPGVKITSVSSGLSHSNNASSREAAQKLASRLNEHAEKIRIITKQICDLESHASSLKSSANQAPRDDDAINVEAAINDANFIFNELVNVGAKIRQLKKQLRREHLEQEIAISENRKLQSYNQTSSRIVKLKVISDAPANGTIHVCYMVGRASWRPSYDILVDASDKTTKLVAYGVVSQQSGEDWNNVPVTLSTAQPSISADLPEFKKVLISERFQSPRKSKSVASFDASEYGSTAFERVSSSVGRTAKGKGAGMASASRVQSKPSAREEPLRLVLRNAAGNAVQLSDGRLVENAQNIRFRDGNYVFENASGVLEKVSAKNVLGIRQSAIETGTQKTPIQANRLRDPSQYLRGLDFRYDLARSETIPSTGTQHRYLLSTETFAGDFYYQIVPAINANAYQMLTVENKRFRPILAGPANIFYGADFIGEMDLPYTQRDGKIAIPLGVDPRISVERQKTNDIDTVGTFTHSRRNRVSSEITVRNRTTDAVRIVCEEAVPQSTTDKIEISGLDFSPEASFDKETGIARWNEILKPAESLKLDVRYTLEYPMNFILEERSR